MPSRPRFRWADVMDAPHPSVHIPCLPSSTQTFLVSSFHGERNEGAFMLIVFIRILASSQSPCWFFVRWNCNSV
jgi:hypothetical protein